MTNTNSNQFNQAKELLDKAKNILIATHRQPTVNSIASSLSLYLALTASGKQVLVACQDEMTVEFNRLVGVNKITNNIENNQSKNLTISFPYKEGSIEKVSYNIENDTFNLVIESRDDTFRITPEKINFSHGSGNIDLIITVDTVKLEDLGSIYKSNNALFQEKPVINIDTHSQNNNFGKVNFIDSQLSSTSELMVNLFSKLGVNIDIDIATNLLSGLVSGSNNFTSVKTTASTFEAAAICLKNGAKRQQLPKKRSPNVQFSSTKTPKKAQSVSISLPTSQTTSFKAKKTTQTIHDSTDQDTKKIEEKHAISKNDSKKDSTEMEKDKPVSTPSDWLKPKIYKGSTLL